MTEFQLKHPLFQALTEFGLLKQQREDAIARIHRANAETKAASAHFHELEKKFVAASSHVTDMYQKFYPDGWDEAAQSAWIGM